jgi:toxin CcdB
MAQFDVFSNPIRAARSTYPFVVAMQSNSATSPSYQLVAPITARAQFAPGGRLTPKVDIEGKAHVVLVPQMAVMRSRDLASTVSSIASARTELLAAIDFLFFGV